MFKTSTFSHSLKQALKSGKMPSSGVICAIAQYEWSDFGSAPGPAVK